MDVAPRDGAVKKGICGSVAEAETRRQVTGTESAGSENLEVALHWRREERGHEFYKCQHGRQAEEADGQYTWYIS